MPAPFHSTHNGSSKFRSTKYCCSCVGNCARFGTQGLYAPTAALFVLAYGSYMGHEIAHRFLETLLGAVIGIGVNAVVFPPVHSRRVRHLRAQLPLLSAELLHDVADGLAEGYSEEQARGWYDRAQRLTDVVTNLREQRRWRTRATAPTQASGCGAGPRPRVRRPRGTLCGTRSPNTSRRPYGHWPSPLGALSTPRMP